MDSYLAIYTDMLLSLQLGNYRGFVSLSRPLYVLAIIDSIEAIESNRINIDNRLEIYNTAEEIIEFE